MKKGFLFAAILFVTATFTNSVSAQAPVKIGIFDEQFMIQLHPDVRLLDSLLQSFEKDSLQSEYIYTVKAYQRADSNYKKDSLEYARTKNTKALELATTDLRNLQYKLYNWQQYTQSSLQQKYDILLLPFRQKVANALSEIIRDEKYTWVLNPTALPQQYFTPSIADNLSIKVALKMQLALPKEYEQAYKAAIGGTSKAAAAPAKAPTKKP
jgi:Skp family chaperone for outer membrane proteins